MKQESPPKRLSVDAFARSMGAISGQDLLSSYPRLMQETQGLGGGNVLSWSARGRVQQDALGTDQVWLYVTAQVFVPLTCQRCLLPAEVPVSVERSFRFVGSEAEAQAQDAEAEEDILALSDDFSLSDLIEDEVLMELPLIPKHEVCPVPVKLAVVDADFEIAQSERQQPFAVLGQLKSRISES
jgi:uncharacterized protein